MKHEYYLVVNTKYVCIVSCVVYYVIFWRHWQFSTTLGLGLFFRQFIMCSDAIAFL